MSDPRFVRANGLPFAYLEQGTGPLALLVHGFPDTAYTWDHALPAVANAGFRAVAPFTRGYFPTAIPTDRRYDLETLGRDLLALIEALGERTAILIGHDWGALAGYAAAALEPDKLQMLVTLGTPHPRSIRLTPRLLWKGRHLFVLRRGSAAAAVRTRDYAYVDELVHRASPAWRSIPATETARAKEAFGHPGCLEAACAYYQTLSPKLPGVYKVSIRVPTVAFAGTHDVLRPDQFERARACFSGSYEVVQVPGGHFMHREHPAAFNAELVRVLTARRRQTA